MKLAVRRSSFNFYESFSDLIFCALVLFVVLVLFLVLNVNKGVMVLRENEAEHEKAVAALGEARSGFEKEKRRHAAQTAQMKRQAAEIRKQHIEIANIMGVNRYTGQNAYTEFTFVLRESGNGYDILPVPAGQFSSWSATLGKETEDERIFRVIADAYAIARDDFTLTQDEIRDLFLSIQRHVAVTAGAESSRTAGHMVVLTHYLASEAASGWFSLSSEVLVDNLTERRERMRKFFLEDIEQYAFRPEFPKNPTSLPVLRFSVSVGSKSIVLGRSTFSPRRLRRVLGAFGGAGLIVQYVPRDEDPVKMPNWVMNEILIPTGYTNRAPDVSGFSVAP